MRSDWSKYGWGKLKTFIHRHRQLSIHVKLSLSIFLDTSLHFHSVSFLPHSLYLSASYENIAFHIDIKDMCVILRFCMHTYSMRANMIRCMFTIA